MTDTQIYRLEVARIMDARKANAARFAPLLRDAITLGIGGILCVFATITAAAMAITGYWWFDQPAGPLLRGGIAIAALAFLVLGVQLWIRHARIPGEIMQIPGYSKAEFQRLAELNHKIRNQGR